MTFLLGFYLGGMLASIAPQLVPPVPRGGVGDAIVYGLTWPVWVTCMLFNAWRNQ
jgi:hypothetical protein